MGAAIDRISDAAGLRPVRSIVLPGGSIRVFEFTTDGAGYRLVPDTPTLLYSLSPGATSCESTIGSRHRFVGSRPNAAFNLIPPGETYSSRTTQPPTFLRFASISFQTLELQALFLPGSDIQITPLPRLVAEDTRVDRLFRLFAELDGAVDEAADEPLVLTHALLALAAATLRPRVPEVAGRAGALDARRLARVREFVEANLASRIALADLAQVANLSSFHFARAFRNATGAPPAAYVQQRRMERACVLLRTTALAIGEIGRQVGYADPARFSEGFRRATRYTPSGYRAQRTTPSAGHAS